MKIAFGRTIPEPWQTGTLVDVGNGDFVVALDPTSESLSVQPDGRFEKRKPGTADAYERAKISNGKLIYSSDGHVYVVPFVELG